MGFKTAASVIALVTAMAGVIVPAQADTQFIFRYRGKGPTAVSAPVTPVDVADAPSVSAGNVSGDQDTSIPLALNASLTDTDGSETLSIEIHGVPGGAALSHGSDEGAGIWSVPLSDLPALSLFPPSGFSGTLGLTLVAIATENSNGTRAQSVVPFNVVVNEAALPTLSLIHI